MRVELLHKLHDELRYDGLDSLKAGIAKDCDDARAFFASMHSATGRQTRATEFRRSVSPVAALRQAQGTRLSISLFPLTPPFGLSLSKPFPGLSFHAAYV